MPLTIWGEVSWWMRFTFKRFSKIIYMYIYTCTQTHIFTHKKANINVLTIIISKRWNTALLLFFLPCCMFENVLYAWKNRSWLNSLWSSSIPCPTSTPKGATVKKIWSFQTICGFLKRGKSWKKWSGKLIPNTNCFLSGPFSVIKKSKSKVFSLGHREIFLHSDVCGPCRV